MMVRKVTKAVFPVAGLGTRFLPATTSATSPSPCSSPTI
jgi:UTP-glucose-1-phosphate uridylyltransferase